MNKLIDGVYRTTWKGKTFRLVVEAGKAYLGSKKGKRFRSLSGAAQGVTGKPTSGKNFWEVDGQAEAQ